MSACSPCFSGRSSRRDFPAPQILQGRSGDRTTSGRKVLGLVLVSFFGMLLLSNIIASLSTFFLAKDLDRSSPSG